MTEAPDSSDYGRKATPSRSKAVRALAMLRAMFSPDLLSKVRGVISVLLDLGRLIDRALAMWHHDGMPMLRHG